MLISSKMGTGTYLLDKDHLPLRPEFEDNEIVMDASHPTCAKVQEKRERDRDREREREREREQRLQKQQRQPMHQMLQQ